MNLRKDVQEHINRELYFSRLEFARLLMADMPYHQKMDKLLHIAREVTILASTMQTFEALLGPADSDPNQSTDELPF